MTDRIKLVLAVILGHTLLHWQDTPWLQGWSRENIVFIRNHDAIPLRPFLLSQRSSKTAEDDWFQFHPHLDILGLGIILLELHLQQPVESYVTDVEKQGPNSSLFMAQSVLKRFEKDMYPNYRIAIEHCLDTRFGEELLESIEDPEERAEKLRQLIYQRIVKPLEDELEAGFGTSITVDDLDDQAKELDISQYGQAFVQEHQITNRQSLAPKHGLLLDDGYESGAELDAVHRNFHAPHGADLRRSLRVASPPTVSRFRSPSPSAGGYDRTEKSMSSPAIMGK